MMVETVTRPHSRGVAGVLREAGLPDLAVHSAGEAVNVYYRDRTVPEQTETRRLERVVRLLDEAGYEAHRSTVVPWLVRVTAKRKAVRAPKGSV